VTIDDTVAPLGDVETPAPAWSIATIPARLVEIGVAGALAAVLLVLLWLGVRPDLASAPSQPFFWLKAFYTGGLAWAALSAATALARPNRDVRPVLAMSSALVVAMLIVAAIQATRLEPAFLAKLFRPVGIWSCLFNIASLAAPMLVFATWGLSRVDLDRPAAIGLAAGLFCGGVAATVYGLHCPHSTFVFVGLWYTTGIAVCGAIGAGALKLLWLRSVFAAPE
jgi:hypothetical protein